MKESFAGPRVIARNGKEIILTSTSPSRAPIPNTRVEKDGYIADIFLSKSGSLDIFHYIIQRSGSAEILVWGQELSLRSAQDSIEEFIRHDRSKLA